MACQASARQIELDVFDLLIGQYTYQIELERSSASPTISRNEAGMEECYVCWIERFSSRIEIQ